MQTLTSLILTAAVLLSVCHSLLSEEDPNGGAEPISLFVIQQNAEADPGE